MPTSHFFDECQSDSRVAGGCLGQAKGEVAEKDNVEAPRWNPSSL